MAEAFARRREADLPPFVAIGSVSILQDAARSRGLDIDVTQLDDRSWDDIWPAALPVVDGFADYRYSPGNPDRQSAQVAVTSLEFATDWAKSRLASAVVTAPLAKSGIAQIDSGFIGQTEFLADACDVPRDGSVMMLAGPSLRTVPMTVHCSIAEVPGRLTQELIVHRSRIVARSLQTDFGIQNPRLAIAGLNPHAGEDGRMGREEIDVIAPAIVQLRTEGIDATGPHPADTLFAPHKRGSYDVAIAMYHDQALVPLKTLDFDEGVNVTLGLPIVRTSPDHGTAFDIAGKGIARPDAMIAAIRMAGEIAARRAGA